MRFSRPTVFRLIWTLAILMIAIVMYPALPPALAASNSSFVQGSMVLRAEGMPFSLPNTVQNAHLHRMRFSGSGSPCVPPSAGGSTHLPLKQSRPATTSYQNGYSPQQIKGAYNLSGSLNGAGVTIAIVVPCHDPNAQSDFDTFSTQFGLPTIAGGCNCFTQVDEYGGQNYPPADAAAAEEASQDIEWTHAIAPKAHILLVEAASQIGGLNQCANPANIADMLTAEDYATAHANVVSNSWACSEFSTETSYDSHFNKPVAITFAAGDYGTPATWPSASPYVLSVGGTTLTINGTTSGGGCISTGCIYGNEAVWNDNNGGAGGGGVSSYETEPGYQNSFCNTTTNNNCNGKRGTPDVAWDADPKTGVAIYDSYYTSGWLAVGGTSIGAPGVAGVIALMDQAYNKTFTTNSLSTRFAYQNDSTATNYSLDYHDIQSGSNAPPGGNCCNADQGYDFANGLGSPNGNNWIAAAGSWNFVKSPNPTSGYNYLYGVAAVSANNIWAVGLNATYSTVTYQGLIEHWNGSKWSSITNPAGSANNILNSVARIPGTKQLWAVGSYYATDTSPEQTLIEQCSGTSCTVMPSFNVPGTDNGLYGITALSTTNAWAVGVYRDSHNNGQILIEHWDGSQWTQVIPQPPNNSYRTNLEAITAVSASNIWAVGSYMNISGVVLTLVEHWNGRSWSVVQSANPQSNSSYLQGVTAIPGTHQVWAVGYYEDVSSGSHQHTLIEQCTTASCSIISSQDPGPTDNSLSGVAAVSVNNAWAVGSSGQTSALIEQWNGTNWNTVSAANIPGSTGASLFAIASVSAYNAWAVGNYSSSSSSYYQTLIERYH